MHLFDRAAELQQEGQLSVVGSSKAVATYLVFLAVEGDALPFLS